MTTNQDLGFGHCEAPGCDHWALVRVQSQVPIRLPLALCFAHFDVYIAEAAAERASAS